jgi:hypothetical protein
MGKQGLMFITNQKLFYRNQVITFAERLATGVEGTEVPFLHIKKL